VWQLLASGAWLRNQDIDLQGVMTSGLGFASISFQLMPGLVAGQQSATGAIRLQRCTFMAHK
jgi:hypothetical protein